MQLPTSSGAIFKIAVVVGCLAVVGTVKYGLKWGDDNIVETTAEAIIKEEIGEPIYLPDLNKEILKA